MDQLDEEVAIVTKAVARVSTGDEGELETLVLATKRSGQLPENINTTGIAADVIKGRRKLLEGIVRAGDQLKTYPAVIGMPYLIWAKPLEILIDSHLEPWNNRARIKGSHRSNRDAYFIDRVSFFYLWDNPSTQNYALVNVASTLVTKGFVVATGNTGILSGGSAGLSASAGLTLHQWAGEPPLSPHATQLVHMYGVHAKGGGFWSGETGKADTKGVFYEAAVEYKYFPVPPGSRAIFEVRLNLETTIWPNGSTSFEFANTVQDNYVQCPGLVITILSGPVMATG